MNIITKFFHELLNPHCPDCIKQRQEELEQKELDREVSAICKTCEILKLELGQANNRINQLLDKVIPSKDETLPVQTSAQQIIQTRVIPWTVKKQQLEQASREKAAALKNAAQPDDKIETLEKELGINTETDNARN